MVKIKATSHISEEDSTADEPSMMLLLISDVDPAKSRTLSEQNESGTE